MQLEPSKAGCQWAGDRGPSRRESGGRRGRGQAASIVWQLPCVVSLKFPRETCNLMNLMRQGCVDSTPRAVGSLAAARPAPSSRLKGAAAATPSQSARSRSRHSRSLHG